MATHSVSNFPVSINRQDDALKTKDNLIRTEQALEARRKQNTTTFKTHARSLRIAADKGDPSAQSELGQCYLRGCGVYRDIPRALYWLTRAARQGEIVAQRQLGTFYFEPYPEHRDIQKAAYWFSLAAGQGDLFSQARLGECYYLGKGVPENVEQAIALWVSAAEQGEAQAQYYLGLEDQFQYSRGECADPTQIALATEWLLKAAGQGHQWARDFVMQRLWSDSPVFLSDFSERLQRLEQAAQQGDVSALCTLGAYYEYGYGVLEDRQKAFHFYTQAAEKHKGVRHMLHSLYPYPNGCLDEIPEAIEIHWAHILAEEGDVDVQFRLGEIYEHGLGVLKDMQKAVHWYTEAAAQGYFMAHQNLERYYREDQKDTCQAMYWMQEAALHKDADAQFQMGKYYYQGRTLPQNYQKAVHWFRKAARQKDQNAQYALGVCYTNGLGVPQDFNKACAWYEKAARNGDRHAEKQLYLWKIWEEPSYEENRAYHLGYKDLMETKRGSMFELNC